MKRKFKMWVLLNERGAVDTLSNGFPLQFLTRNAAIEYSYSPPMSRQTWKAARATLSIDAPDLIRKRSRKRAKRQ